MMLPWYISSWKSYIRKGNRNNSSYAMPCPAWKTVNKSQLKNIYLSLTFSNSLPYLIFLTFPIPLQLFSFCTTICTRMFYSLLTLAMCKTRKIFIFKTNKMSGKWNGIGDFERIISSLICFWSCAVVQSSKGDTVPGYNF